MRDRAPELGAVAFNFDKGAAKLGLFGALRERFLQQAAEPVLLALNPEDVLNFLPGARARNLSVQEHASYDLVAREATCVCEVVKVSGVRVSQAHRDSMLEIPHSMSISIAIALSRRNRCACANKPKVLSAFIKCPSANVREVRARHLQFCWQTKLHLALR
jgi:hypothetical protein